ncbi:MAG: hypothetical protein ACKO1L_12160 [Brachymonas sp.]
MAAWLKPFLLALVAALVAHALGLVSIASQMKVAGSVLEERSDPLFTRTIEAASTPAEITPSPKTQALPAPALKPLVTLPDSQPVQPTPTVAEPTVTVVVTSPTGMARTPTEATMDALFTPAKPEQAASATVAEPQIMTSQPAGKTDSLLATGEWPADTRVSYVMTGYYNGDLHGKGQVQWTRSGLAADRYQVRVVVDAGLLEFRMTSQGRVSAQGLLPEAFEEYIKIVGRDARVRPLKLETSELVLSDGKRIARPAQHPMAVQDSVSQFIDLGHRIQQGRDKLETGQVISIWLGRPGGLDQWVYDVGEVETLSLPRIGSVPVFPLKPRPVVNARGTIVMSMWLAPSLQYLPAKIRIDVNAQTHVILTAERLEQR